MVPVGKLNEAATGDLERSFTSPSVCSGSSHLRVFIYKSTVLHSVLTPTPPTPFTFLSFKQGPPGEDAGVLKLWGVNHGSTCDEAETGRHSRINCISRQGHGEKGRNAVALTAAASLSRWEGDVSEIPRVHLCCHLYCNCPLFCHSDYARQGHANEEQKIGCLKVKSRKHQSLSRREASFPFQKPHQTLT